MDLIFQPLTLRMFLSVAKITSSRFCSVGKSLEQSKGLSTNLTSLILSESERINSFRFAEYSEVKFGNYPEVVIYILEVRVTDTT